MALSTQPYKGARDFYPEDKRLQKFLFSKMREVAEGFGYEEYDAPVLEPLELYLAKTGEEIVNEQTYTFEDRGGRKVAIRPEMTPTVSRMVAAKRQELAYPLRWYSIPNLWRYERPQRGRLREHWQLNVDIFGLNGLEAEHEVIVLADSILRSFGARHEMYTIRLNSRVLMDMMFYEVLSLDQTQGYTMAKLIDRMNKMDQVAFMAEMEMIFTPSQREAGKPEQLLQFLRVESLETLLPEVQHSEPVQRLQRLMKLLEQAHITNAVFDPTVMRGFDYYTDIVFEVFDNHPDNNRAMFGGGRYDGLVGLFGVEPVPTVGFGMGDVTLANFVETHELMPPIKPETDAYVVLIGDIYEQAQQAIRDFRKMGLNIAVDMTGKKPDKQIKTAVKKNLSCVIFIGEQELESGLFKLKNLSTGEDQTHSPERLVSIIKDYRRPDDRQ